MAKKKNNDKRIAELSGKWRSGDISEEEIQEFDRWYNGFDDSETHFSSHHHSVEELREDLHARLLSSLYINPGSQLKKARLFFFFRAAAAVVLVVGAAFWIYINTSQSSHPSNAGKGLLVSDFSPGKNRAVLKLSNGESIHLSDAQSGVVIAASNLSYADGSDLKVDHTVLSAGKISQLMVATPRGGQYQVTLPDGTRAWLNAASSISFPSSFEGKPERTVQLTGEAYFEVKKDSGHPFIVNSRNQRVQVLGTHFNIDSYDNESAVSTTLMEGSVKIYNENNAESSAVLRPGEQSKVSGGVIRVQDADTELVMAWKNNKFMFEDEDIRSIMRKVERWYDVEVLYLGEVPRERFIGSVSRFDNISKVLGTLELTEKVHFKIEGRRIIVSK